MASNQQMFRTLILVLAVVFGALGLIPVVLAVVLWRTPAGPWLLLGGSVFLLVAVTAVVLAVRERRRSARITPDTSPLRPAVPVDVALLGGHPRPWPVPDVAAALATELAGTPYAVEHNDDTITVSLDLADQTWWVLAGAQSLRETFSVSLVRERDGVFERTDRREMLHWQAGVPVRGGLVGSGVGSVQLGRTFQWSKRIEWGASAEKGVGRQVDYTFSTADVAGPLQRVLGLAGWRTALDPSSHAGLVIGLLGIGIALAMLVTMGIVALAGGFG